jgi:hypothetical protein
LRKRRSDTHLPFFVKSGTIREASRLDRLGEVFAGDIESGREEEDVNQLFNNPRYRLDVTWSCQPD